MTYNKDYFTIKALGDGNVTITIPANVNSSYATSISYSKDRSNWTETVIDDTDQTITIPVITGDKVYLKGIARQWATSDAYYTTINSTANINVSGNAMSLLYGDVFVDKTSFPADSQYTLCGLFKNNKHLIDAGQLKLPAMTLTSYCYEYMFYRCTSLTSAPELHATTLANCCYYHMLSGCTSLITAPVLPATTLADYCYNSMFSHCTSLTTAPALPATTLVSNCYVNMFRGCKSLTSAPELPAKTLASQCYFGMFYECSKLNSITMLATNISASGCLSGWVYGVSSTGTFIKNNAATWNVSGKSGIPSGWTVQTASA